MSGVKSGPIVAIIDDDQAVGNAIEVLLRSIGLTARTFCSGEQLLGSPELDRVGCLVVDFDMPMMNGLDLLGNLFRLGREIPFVIITAYPSEEIRIRALQSGAVSYLTKPFDDGDLLNGIRAALQIAEEDRLMPGNL